ncbi:MAG: hypothetical protein GX224_01405 [Thermoplasmatales archaeon]|nr:hypothetical protein [Thermoplasmatales archaeon]
MSERRVAANEIIEGILSRERTDIVLPPAMVAFVVLTYVAIAIAYVAEVVKTHGADIPPAQTFGLSAIYLIGNGLVLAVFYLLITRNRWHSKRESGLRKSLIRYAEACNLSCGADITPQIARLKAADAEVDAVDESKLAGRKMAYALIPMAFGSMVLAAVDTAQNAIWVFVFLYGVSLLILLAMAPSVTEFPRHHEMAAIGFAEEFRHVAPFLGISAVPHGRTMGYRSFWLFVVLTALTAGFFVAAWAYLAFRDMNWHFTVQWRYEDEILRSVRDKEVSVASASDAELYTLEGMWA